MKPLALHTCGENFDGELSPEALAVVRATDNPAAPPAEQTDILAAREGHALAAYDIDVPLEGMRITERFIPANGKELRVRIYTPASPGPLPVLVFAHGGCWTFCSIDSHDQICRFYARAVGCLVVSVDYALAPEAPYPHGLDDFHAAVLWCFDHAEEIGGDPTRIAVAGDSAGGNLSAAVARRMASDPKRKLRLQLLIYPICDAANLSGNSMDRYAKGYFFTRDILAWTASLYCKNDNPANPEISPLLGDVSETLAPACFLIAECDILSDQGLAYAEKLHAAGVPVDARVYRGVPHAFLAMAGRLESGLAALKDSAERLRLAFY
jgi:acetyl esterase